VNTFASLDAFTRVVDERGFAAAGRRLGQSRAQVNKAVIALEEHLGVQLLNRTTRQVSPTPAGRAFYDRARAILIDLAEAEAAVRDDQREPRGDLTINAPMSFGTMHLGPALAEFMARYPDIRVQLVLNDRFVDPLLDGFDVTVRIAEPAPTPSLIDHQIVDIKRVICAAPALLQRTGEPATPADLAGAPCLHYGSIPSGAVWRLTGPDGPVDARVAGVACSNNGEVLRDCALRGLGFVLLPTFIVGADLRAGRLIAVLKDYHPRRIVLTLLYPPHRHLSTRIRLLVQYFYERFGEPADWDQPEQ
jgi:DNA-binding transcriptional LysR family regulator